MQDIDVGDLRSISELIYRKYHYDFRNYALSSFRRRVLRILETRKLTLSGLLTQLESTPAFVEEFVDALTVNVTEMFRDPTFWQALRDHVIPAVARRRKRFTIWHAGCSSGEEVITMAIILQELDLLQRATITATDLDGNMLARASAASYPVKNLSLYENNYRVCRGTVASLQPYYQQVEDQAVFHPALTRGATFLRHDLVSGPLPGRFDIILCRNVMIYFNQDLQNTVLRKFHQALEEQGYLCIGSKESLLWCDDANRFTTIHGAEKIYRRR